MVIDDECTRGVSKMSESNQVHSFVLYNAI
jgi:hypothetical protein